MGREGGEVSEGEEGERRREGGEVSEGREGR